MGEEAEPLIRTPDGRLVTGKKLNFKTIKEEWNEYELEDGSKLYVKLALIDVVRLNEFSQFGEPVYNIISHNLVKVKASKRAIEEVKEKLKPEREPEIS